MRRHRDQTAGGAPAALLLAALLLAPGAAAASAAPGAVCLLPAAAGDGLEPRAVRAALLIEARKAGRPARVVTAQRPADCPLAAAGVRVGLGPGARATLDAGRGAPQAFDLSDTLPVDRARAVARAALAALALLGPAPAVGDAAPEVLVDLSEPIVPPPPPMPLAPAVVLTAGGGYLRGLGAGTDHAVVDGEVALWLYEGRLALGVAGAYLPEVEVAGGEPAARLSGGELTAFVRGGWPLGPFLLRFGLGAGYQWRRLRVRSDWRLDEPGADDGAGLVAVEAEALWRFGGRFSAHVVIPGRVYLGGVGHEWKGRALRDAPRGAAGVGLRLGVAF